jgi:hypothetical protein
LNCYDDGRGYKSRGKERCRSGAHSDQLHAEDHDRGKGKREWAELHDGRWVEEAGGCGMWEGRRRMQPTGDSRREKKA